MKQLRSALGLAAALLLAGSAGCGAEGGESPPLGTGGGWDNAGGSTDSQTGAGGAGGGAGGTEGRVDDDVPGSRAGGDGDDLAQRAPGTGKSDLPECTSGLPTLAFHLSSDDSNSMASPVIAREHLRAGHAPNPAQIRTYEFLNYYNVLYDLPDPQAQQLGLFAEMEPLGPSPRTGLPTYRLQVGVQAFQIPRVPMVVTFVVDASGSLVGEGIERERAALLAITKGLQPGDIVHIVKWGTDENVLLENYVATTPEANEAALAAAVNQLAPGGGSDLHGGLVKGYELAKAHFDPEKLNRVVLLSDGGANLGQLDRTVIADAAAEAGGEGIYLVGIGVGPAQGYTDNLMDLVTDAGRGAYVYLDGPEEAEAIFSARFDEIMNVAARNVRVRVDLPEYVDIEKFYGEEWSNDPTNIDPQNLAPGDSMVLNQVIYLEDPAVACGFDTVTVKVTWETPLTHEAREFTAPPVSLLDLVSKPPSKQMLEANAIIAYAEALKSNDAAELSAALDQVKAAEKATGDADLAEIVDLLQNHPVLSP